eukprot:jgi/Bigna1/87448/estExt_fgenesh1_pg.C_200151
MTEKETLPSFLRTKKLLFGAPVEKLGGAAQRGNLRSGTNAPMAEAVLSVQGMTCSSCVGTIETALKETPGVMKATVALMTEVAEIKYDPAKTDVAKLIEEIEDVGFEANLIRGNDPTALGDKSAGDIENNLAAATTRRIRFFIDEDLGGRANDKSSGSVSSVISVMPGVERVTLEEEQQQMSHKKSTILVDFDSSVVSAKEMFAQLVRRLDHHVNPQAVWGGGREAPIVAIMLMMDHNFFMDFWGVKFGIIGEGGEGGASLGDLSMGILATPVQIFSGRHFYYQAYKGLRRCHIGMAFLVVMSTSAAYVTSAIFLIAKTLGDHQTFPLFFDTSAMLLTFVLLGKFLESIAKSRTTDAISKLLSLSPNRATLLGRYSTATNSVEESKELEGEGECEDFPSVLLEVDDVIRVVPGARFPVDGIVLEGHSAADESMLTGELLPVAKERGSVVVGGTLNLEGMLIVRITGVGEDTALQQIVNMVQQAQSTKPAIASKADKLSNAFVPFVVVVSMVTLVVWLSLALTHSIPPPWMQGSPPFIFALKFAMSVLVIACPCSLGLATPTAVMVGTGVAASVGILIKSGEGIEAASAANVVAFDKTGTLTVGKPRVEAVYLVEEDEKEEKGKTMHKCTEEELISLAASAEKSSDHPLAVAIVNLANERGLALHTPRNATSRPGYGIQ